MRKLLLYVAALALAAPACAQIFGPATPSLLGNGSAAAPSYSFAAEPTLGLYRASGGGQLGFASLGVGVMALNGQQILLASGVSIGWEPGLLLGASADVLLSRDAASTLALVNGTASQSFRIYNTFTDASNFERLNIAWNANNAEIYTHPSGTGANRPLRLGVNGGPQWQFNTSGHFTPIPDNTYDLGAGATRPRTVYAATSMNINGGSVPYALCKSGAIVTAPADTTEDTLFTCALPALSANSAIKIQWEAGTTNNANAKTLRIRLGGAQVTQFAAATAIATFMNGTIINRATNNQQGVINISQFNATATTLNTVSNAVDTTSAQNLTFTCQKATAGDSCTSEYVLVELVP